MLLRGALLLSGVLAFALPAFASSQTLSPGTRVRVTAPALMLDRQRGQLVSLDRGSLVLEGSGSDLGSRSAAPRRWVIPRDAVAQLERSLGIRANTRKGLLIGAGVGLAAGLVVTRSGGGSACRGSGDYGEFCATIIGASTAGGALLGALVGAVARSERWQVVSTTQFQ